MLPGSGIFTPLKPSGVWWMATLELNNMTTILSDDLLRAAEDVPQLREAILKSQADILEPAIKQSVTVSQLVDTGQLRDSIGRYSRKGGSEIRIGPSGVRAARGSRSGLAQKVRNGHLGYIYEYGLPGRGIAPRHWMSNAVNKSQDKAYAAAEDTADEFLKKQNL